MQLKMTNHQERREEEGKNWSKLTRGEKKGRKEEEDKKEGKKKKKGKITSRNRNVVISARPQLREKKKLQPIFRHKEKSQGRKTPRIIT